MTSSVGSTFFENVRRCAGFESAEIRLGSNIRSPGLPDSMRTLSRPIARPTALVISPESAEASCCVTTSPGATDEVRVPLTMSEAI